MLLQFRIWISNASYRTENSNRSNIHAQLRGRVSIYVIRSFLNILPLYVVFLCVDSFLHWETTNNQQHSNQWPDRVCKQANVVKAMIERKRGCILLSGKSTCNVHGGFEFGSVAPTRAALRSLAQSMFQAYGPMGIKGSMEKEKLTNPHEIAVQFLNAYKQPSTVWSYEIMLSPGFAARTVDMRM